MTMDCDWTERISALIDGELDAEESRAAELHLEACAACRRVRQGFLLVRSEVSSYGSLPGTVAERRILDAVLASKSAATPRSRDRNSFADFFAGRISNPAFVGAAALVLIAITLGIVAFMVSRDSAPSSVVLSTPAPSEVDKKRSTEAPPSAAPSPTILEGERPRHTIAHDRHLNTSALNGKTRTRHRTRPRTEDAAVSDAVAGTSRPKGSDSPSAQPAVPVSSASTAAAPARDRSRDRTLLDPARHAEQAQMLLRSFRNARLADGDIAYERARSKRLLYRNIMLRREATAKREQHTARALARLEPILLDIANLPDNPAAEEVDSIRERMRKQNIVVLLQASTISR